MSYSGPRQTQVIFTDSDQDDLSFSDSEEDNLVLDFHYNQLTEALYDNSLTGLLDNVESLLICINQYNSKSFQHFITVLFNGFLQTEHDYKLFASVFTSGGAKEGFDNARRIRLEAALGAFKVQLAIASPELQEQTILRAFKFCLADHILPKSFINKNLTLYLMSYIPNDPWRDSEYYNDMLDHLIHWYRKNKIVDLEISEVRGDKYGDYEVLNHFLRYEPIFGDLGNKLVYFVNQAGIKNLRNVQYSSKGLHFDHHLGQMNIEYLEINFDEFAKAGPPNVPLFTSFGQQFKGKPLKTINILGSTGLDLIILGLPGTNVETLSTKTGDVQSRIPKGYEIVIDPNLQNKIINALKLSSVHQIVSIRINLRNSSYNDFMKTPGIQEALNENKNDYDLRNWLQDKTNNFLISDLRSLVYDYATKNKPVDASKAIATVSDDYTAAYKRKK